MRIIGYTYEADVHCVDCTRKRFPRESAPADYPYTDSAGVPLTARDREGNVVHPITDIDESANTEHCGDCREKLL